MTKPFVFNGFSWSDLVALWNRKWQRALNDSQLTFGVPVESMFGPLKLQIDLLRVNQIYDEVQKARPFYNC